MSTQRQCQRCDDPVDITSVDSNTVITVRDINKPRRYYLCDLCGIGLEEWIKDSSNPAFRGEQ